MTPYSSIAHLAHALFLNHEPKRSLMILLTSHFDASSSDTGNRIMTVGGFVSTEEKWVKFEREWNEVLQRFEVPYLHMKEFAHSTGAFKAWKGKEDLRRDFIIELLKVTKRRVHKGFGCSVFLDDYEEVNKTFTLDEKWGNPYSLAGSAAVSRVLDWKNRRFPRNPIKCIFEDDDPGNGELMRLLKIGKIPYSFTPKKEKQNGTIKYIVPFQIADFAAWETRAAFLRMTADPLRELRKSFITLFEQIPGNWSTFTKEKLEGLGKSKNLQRSKPSASFGLVADNQEQSDA